MCEFMEASLMPPLLNDQFFLQVAMTTGISLKSVNLVGHPQRYYALIFRQREGRQRNRGGKCIYLCILLCSLFLSLPTSLSLRVFLSFRVSTEWRESSNFCITLYFFEKASLSSIYLSILVCSHLSIWNGYRIYI